MTDAWGTPAAAAAAAGGKNSGQTSPKVLRIAKRPASAKQSPHASGGSSSPSQSVTLAKRPPRKPSPSAATGSGPVSATSATSMSTADISRGGASLAASAAATTAGDLSVYTADIDEALLAALDNPKHRLSVLKLEDRLAKFVAKARGPRALRFPPMQSFQRLLLHRLAERFNLQHEAVVDEEAPAGGNAGTNYSEANRTKMILTKTELTKAPGFLLLHITQVRERGRGGQLFACVPAFSRSVRCYASKIWRSSELANTLTHTHVRLRSRNYASVGTCRLICGQATQETLKPQKKFKLKKRPKSANASVRHNKPARLSGSNDKAAVAAAARAREAECVPLPTKHAAGARRPADALFLSIH